MASEDSEERNRIDKKFLDDYVDAARRGFQLQVKDLGEWKDIEYVEEEVYVSHVTAIFDGKEKEWCLITPFGRYFRKTVRIWFEDRDKLIPED